MAVLTYTNAVSLYTVFNQVIKVTFFQKVQSYVLTHKLLRQDLHRK